MLASQFVLAGSFGVAPIRLTLSADQPAGMLTVRNSSDEETVVQLQANTWSQHDGADVLEPTRDLIAVPPLFTLPPGGSQVVRVGLRRPPDAAGELTYRLLLREVPPQPEDGFAGLQVALNLSLPVFVVPVGGAEPEPEWWLERDDSGAVRFGVGNRGSAHLQVRSVNLEGPDGRRIEGQGLPVYLLPGQRRSWPLASGLPSGSWLVVADTDAGPMESELLLGTH